ncbi:hypothetical protein AJ78_04600 [Emergomyces pasteurianus Ep9510]|uniref:Uncharacterized protein n=1 Tax=Emergomyces pasteurianus Ep9510 TaxID=1447872 RepID=A0A1J9Q4I7_9EURO|nr:hypothetical protein AJ78_04600 [Emergomyces pasteurianus Ep9510]
MVSIIKVVVRGSASVSGRRLGLHGVAGTEQRYIAAMDTLWERGTGNNTGECEEFGSIRDLYNSSSKSSSKEQEG